jgi:type VI secretion system secreted protein Hcp
MASAIFIKFPNGIAAETTQSGHEESVAAMSVSWGVGRAVSTSFTSSGRETSTPTFSEFVFTKMFDSASNDLALAAAKGTSFDEVTVTFRKDTGDDQLDYLVYTLTDVLISSYSMSSGGETPMESLSLNYTKIKGLYVKQADDHSAGSEHEFEYNLRTQV